LAHAASLAIMAAILYSTRSCNEMDESSFGEGGNR
jgi:hypothetical protein